MAKNNMTVDRVQAAMIFIGGDENLDMLMDGRAKLTFEIISRLTTVTLSATKKPQRLKDMEGVWLSTNATNLFTSVDTLPAVKKRTVEHRDLVEPLAGVDTEKVTSIITGLGGEDAAVFDSVAELETAISQLIAKQLGGKSDDLHNDGKTNIFYVRDPQNPEQVLFVPVRGDSGGSGWFVSCGPVYALQWRAGNRVFKATAA